MAVSDWKTTPAENLFIGTIPLSEGQLTGAMVNNAYQQLMAEVKVAFNGVPVATDYVPKTGGAFTGGVTRAGQGAFLHHVSTTALSGRVFVQSIGASDPAGLQEGDIIIDY